MKTLDADLKYIGDILDGRGFTMYVSNNQDEVIIAWIAKTTDSKYIVVDSDYECTIWDVMSGYRGNMTDDDFARAIVGGVEDYEALRAKCTITDVGIMYALGISFTEEWVC